MLLLLHKIFMTQQMYKNVREFIVIMGENFLHIFIIFYFKKAKKHKNFYMMVIKLVWHLMFIACTHFMDKNYSFFIILLLFFYFFSYSRCNELLAKLLSSVGWNILWDFHFVFHFFF